jgi:hypothetical protein
VAFEGMSEDQIVESLLGKSEAPVGYYKIKRLSLEIDLQGLLANKVYETREQCTTKKKSKGRVETEFDEEKFNCLLITQATVGLRVVVQEATENTEKKVIEFSGWGDQRFLSKYKLSGPDQVVKRMLLAGELDSLGNSVLDLSGYNTDLEDVKN